MIKKFIIGIAAIFISVGTVLSIADAGTGGGRRGVPPTVPEPVSCILVLAGGATLEVVRRLRKRRNSKILDQDKDNVIS